MHDILILTEPVELVGMLKSQQMHDILILTEPVELVGMLKSQLKCTILTLPVELVGMLKSQLNARYLNSHWTSGVGGNAKITT
jgi:hypothetical protein